MRTSWLSQMGATRAGVERVSHGRRLPGGYWREALVVVVTMLLIRSRSLDPLPQATDSYGFGRVTITGAKRLDFEFVPVTGNRTDVFSIVRTSGK